MDPDDDLQERTFSTDERDKMAKNGQAMPDGSYPIATVADLENAIAAFGRAKNQAAVKQHIIKRAKALGATDKLPAGWLKEAESDEPVTLLSEGALLESVAGSDGWDWRVQIIQAGVSKNRTEYPLATLHKRANLYEGVPAFYGRGRDHNENERGFDSVGGWFRAPRPNSRGVEATFSINRGKPELKESFQQAWDISRETGRLPFGFSHVVPGGKFKTSVHKLSEGLVRRVDDFWEIDSVDIVMRPSAGGELLGLVAAVDARQEGILAAMNDLLTRYRAGESLTEAELTQLASEAPEEFAKATAERLTASVKDDPKPTAVAAPETDALNEAVKKIELRAAKAECRAFLTEKLAEATTLPAVMKDAIRADYERLLTNGPFEEAELVARIERDRATAASLMEAASLPHTGSITVTEDQREKYGKAMDGLFEGRAVDGIAPFLTLRQAYSQISGTRLEYISPRLARAVLAEAAAYVPADYQDGGLHEAIDTSTFAQLLGDSITRRMLREYNQPNLMSWQAISERVPLNDFRTQRRMRMGGYGDLPDVSEGAPYQPLTSPTDEEATYAPSKVGGLESLTFEMITNDDVGAVRRIPVKLGRAAARTLYHAVWNDTILDNPNTTYDSTALFHANHANTGTAALDEAGLLAAENAMRDQTGYGETAHKLGAANMPKYLIIPNELRNVANKLVNSPQAVTANENATTPNLFQGQYQIIVVDDWTDANDWYLATDPMNTPILEVGFLGGREDPELFVQDQPTVGSQFTADKTTYKIRHIWGVGILDHRGLYRNVVA
jgi:hypothetical protein